MYEYDLNLQPHSYLGVFRPLSYNTNIALKTSCLSSELCSNNWKKWFLFIDQFPVRVLIPSSNKAMQEKMVMILGHCTQNAFESAEPYKRLLCPHGVDFKMWTKFLNRFWIIFSMTSFLMVTNMQVVNCLKKIIYKHNYSQ